MNQEVKNEAMAEIVTQENSPEAYDEFAPRNTQPSKKQSKAGKVILTIVLVLVGLVLLALIALGIAGFTVFNKATAEVALPTEQKAEASDMTLFIAEACVSLLSEDQIVVGNDDLQMLVEKVKGTVEGSLAGTPVELKDLFLILSEDKGTIYGQVFISELEVKGINIALNKDVYFTADIDVSYEAPNIVAQIKEVNVGTLTIPVSLITQFTGNVQLPEGLKLEGDELYYDVSGLDAMIDEMLPTVMSESLGDNLLSSALSDLLVESTNVEITGADIIDDELIIEGHIF